MVPPEYLSGLTGKTAVSKSAGKLLHKDMWTVELKTVICLCFVKITVKKEILNLMFTSMKLNNITLQ